MGDRVAFGALAQTGEEAKADDVGFDLPQTLALAPDVVGQRRLSAFSERRAGEDATYAALDLGTNNCRLLVARPTRSAFRVVDAYSRIVRLGEGIAITKRLSDAAIHRSLEALKVCRSKIDARGVTRMRLVATEACRVAENGPSFIARVEREAGLKLEIIDRRTEAHLAAAGCSSLADPAANSIVLFDIGGGSTEIVWLVDKPRGRAGERIVQSWISIPFGVVTLADSYGGADVTRPVFASMVAEARAAMDSFVREARGASEEPRFHLLGTSGTVTTVAGVFLGLERYDRRRVDGMWMSAGEVEATTQRLLSMTHQERGANGCIGADRADLVLPGCAILQAIRDAFPAQRLRIADRGLREGMLIGLMQADGVWWGRRGAGR